MTTTKEDALFKYLKRNEDFEHQIAALADGVDAIQDWDEEDLIACAHSFWSSPDLDAFIADELNADRRFEKSMNELCVQIYDGFNSNIDEHVHVRIPDDSPSYLDLWLNGNDEFFRFYLTINGSAYKVEYWLREMDGLGLTSGDYHTLTVEPAWANDLMELFQEAGCLNS